jgi:hypothetical protein
LHLDGPAQVIRMVGESQEAVGAGVGTASGGTNKMPTLEEYGTNLTRQAEEGKLDPCVVGGCCCSLGMEQRLARAGRTGTCGERVGLQRMGPQGSVASADSSGG